MTKIRRVRNEPLFESNFADNFARQSSRAGCHITKWRSFAPASRGRELRKRYPVFCRLRVSGSSSLSIGYERAGTNARSVASSRPCQAVFGPPNFSAVPVAHSLTARPRKSIRAGIPAASPAKSAEAKCTPGPATTIFLTGKWISRHRPPSGKGGPENSRGRCYPAMKLFLHEMP